MNEKQVLKHTVRYDEGLLKALKDPKEARAYLEVALDECEASGETGGLLLALRDVAQAQGGVGALAEALRPQPRTPLPRAFKPKQAEDR